MPKANDFEDKIKMSKAERFMKKAKALIFELLFGSLSFFEEFE